MKCQHKSLKFEILDQGNKMKLIKLELNGNVLDFEYTEKLEDLICNNYKIEKKDITEEVLKNFFQEMLNKAINNLDNNVVSYEGEK